MVSNILMAFSVAEFGSLASGVELNKSVTWFNILLVGLVEHSKATVIKES